MLLESVPGSSCAPGAHACGQPSSLSTPGTRHSSYAPNRADLVRVAIAGLIVDDLPVHDPVRAQTQGPTAPERRRHRRQDHMPYLTS
jgi:hypothetical protein